MDVSAICHGEGKELTTCCCTPLRPFTAPVPLPASPVFSVSASFALPFGATGTVNINNQAGAPITITLPPNPVLDQSLKFKDVGGNASTYTITIVSPDSSTIDLNPNYNLVSDYMAIELYWMGTQWGTR